MASLKSGPEFTVTMTWVERKEKVRMQFAKNIDIGRIKELCNGEWGIPVEEQLLLFRGRQLAPRAMSEKELRKQPLNVPDLADILEEAGEDGLQMAVVHVPFKLPQFIKKEKVEAVNEKLKTGATLLHRAVRKCDVYVVEELLVLEDFEGIDARDRSGQTALHVATTCRHRECCEAIVQAPRFKAIAAKDVEGRTALHYAAMWGDAAAVKMIAEHPNMPLKAIIATDKNSRTALECAEDMGHFGAMTAIKTALSLVKDAPDPSPANEEEFAQEDDIIPVEGIPPLT